MPENLHKSRTNKVFAGVCGGLAEYFRVDATLIRLAWALAFFLGGTGFVLYILALIIMPDDPNYVKTANQNTAANGETVEVPSDNAQESSQESQNTYGQYHGEEKRHMILGVVLVFLGAYFLLERWFPIFKMHNWWPVILIILGVFVLMRGKGGSR